MGAIPARKLFSINEYDCLILLCIAGLSVLTLFRLDSVSAQIVLPNEYPDWLHISHQEAVIVHHSGTESLVWELRYEFEPGSTRSSRYYRPSDYRVESPAPSDRLAWIIPVPQSAQRSEAPPDSLLSDLYAMTHPSEKAKFNLRTLRPTAVNRFGGSIFQGGIEEGNKQTLSWTMIEESGEEALDQVARWLSENGFSALESTTADDYADAGWTFAIGVLENPDAVGTLGPVAFHFASSDLVFPLRFQENAGEFDLAIYALSGFELDKYPLSGLRIQGVNGWENLHREAWFKGFIALQKIDAPPSLLSHLEFLKKDVFTQLSPDELLFYAWEGERMNGYGQTTADFSRDLVLSEKGTKPTTSLTRSQGGSSRISVGTSSRQQRRRNFYR